MRINDIILKKRYGESLTKEEIDFWIKGLTDDSIPLYQSSALAMAIVLNGMIDQEIFYLTSAMKRSGDILDLKEIEGIVLDKHSTGGVGDKTSLVLLPMVASCGLKIAKMSGRGLGHTGGTLDKLESIPGLSTSINEKEFIKMVNKIGIAIISQTKSLAPADKKLYALRDVTGTVDSIPLIASSVMSKKLASGADTILLDVTVGSGAFMKDINKATVLANLMIRIGCHNKKDTRVILSNMDEPLGHAIGNILEIKEVIESLKGNGPFDLMTLCYEAGAIMLMQSGLYKNKEEAIDRLKYSITSGEAFNKFKELIKEEGGDISYILHPEIFAVSKNIIDIKAPKSGYIHEINALTIGLMSMELGAGRNDIKDKIDPTAGIYIYKKVSEYVKEGDLIATIYTNKEDYQEIISQIINAFTINSDKVDKPKVILGVLE